MAIQTTDESKIAIAGAALMAIGGGMIGVFVLIMLAIAAGWIA